MGERVNIARIAEIISADIFSKLGWESHGTPNESWKCDEPAHGKADHPTDATFVYEDPYSGKYVHLIVGADLRLTHPADLNLTRGWVPAL